MSPARCELYGGSADKFTKELRRRHPIRDIISVHSFVCDVVTDWHWRPNAWRQSHAIAFTLIETATPNDVDPQARLADVLSRIVYRKINRVDEPLPWNCIAG